MPSCGTFALLQGFCKLQGKKKKNEVVTKTLTIQINAKKDNKRKEKLRYFSCFDVVDSSY